MLFQHGLNIRVIGRFVRVSRNVLLVILLVGPVVSIWAGYSTSLGEVGNRMLEFFVKSLFPLLCTLVFFELAVNVLRWKYPYEFFERREYKLSGAYRYDVVKGSMEEFLIGYRKSILKDNFEFFGWIENQFNAKIEVYVRSLKLNREAILIIETEVFTEDLLLEHMLLFKSFITEYAGYPKWEWKKRLRTVIFVRKMSLPLQVLLSARNMLGREIGLPEVVHGQVYAIVGEESKVYVKVLPKDSTREDKINWLENYFVDFEKPEHVWKDVKWKDIEHEFPQYKDLVMAVHKALNVWKGGYKEQND